MIGRYVFTPGIFDALDRITPGVGGELQLTDAIGLLLEPRAGLRPGVHARSLRHRAEARLPARQHRARARPARPRPRAGRLPPAARRATASRDPARRGPGRDLRRGAPASRRSTPTCADALGLVLAERVSAPEAVPPFPNTAMDGYAVQAADTAGASEEHAGPAARRRRARRRARADRRGRAGRGDPHHDRRADARRCRRHRDGRAHRRATATTACSSRWRSSPVGTCAAPAATSRPVTWCSSRATVLTAARIGVLATVDARRVRGLSARARRRALDRRRARRVGPARAGQDPRLESADAPRAARRCRRRTDRSRLGARRRGVHDHDAARRGRPLRRGDHERRGVGRRLRLRERRARAHRGRRSARRLTRRLVPGGDQAREAVVLRDGAGHPRVRAPRQPGVVVRELRAVRATGVAPDDGPPADRSGRRSVPPPPTRCPGRSTASSISTGSSSTWSTGATSRPRCVPRRAMHWPRPPRPMRSPLVPDGEGVAAGDDITVMLLLDWTDRSAVARVRSLRPNRRDGRSPLSPDPRTRPPEGEGRTDARVVPGRPSPSPPQDGSRCPHVRATRRTGRFSPSARCSPRGCRVAHQREPSPRSVTRFARHPA